MKKTALAILVGAGLALLAACSGSMPLEDVPDPGILPDQPSATFTPTATPETEAAPPVETEEPQAQPPAEPSATPTVRPGLEATDPASVDLASGKPTLLEFFAFW